MGFEIKNICTVVPNPYHKIVKGDNNNYYYFSLFITPKLQFDGTLKEFYEMLHWPEYAEKIFWNWKIEKNQFLDRLDDKVNGELQSCFLFTSENHHDPIKVQKDYSLVSKVLFAMKIIDTEDQEIGEEAISQFLVHSKKVWKKLFHENVPVEAWPIYLKPQLSTVTLPFDEKNTKKESVTEEKKSTTQDIGAQIIHGTQTASRSTIVNNPVSHEKTSKYEDIKQKSLKAERFDATKFRQEFHKKISALARYPHILRILGLIQDFKIEKKQFQGIASNFFLNFNINNLISFKDAQYPFDEFFKSVQFVTPFTRCEVVDNRLRSYLIHPSKCKNGENEADEINKSIYGTQIPDYKNYVLDGFLKTSYNEYERNDSGCYKLDDSNNLVEIFEKDDQNANKIIDGKPIPIITDVFTIDQEYYEDKSSDFSDSQTPKKNSNVVGINEKTFSDEDVSVLRQKVADKPKISKGFSIKVHGQPGSILTSMDQQFDKITDDNIENKSSAFMAHHLDCGYRIDVKLKDEKEWKSLCRREAKYKVDFNDDNWFTDIFENKKLFEKLEDEPWIEEVRQIDEDGNENRFAEVARWNGWSLTCPPLYKNFSAPNKEAGDMELENIKPIGLPKLRFGEDHQYQFRIRTVDICGNGSEVNDACDSSCILSIFPRSNEKITYKRQEEIGPPLFFPTDIIVKNLDSDGAKRQINLKYKGEDNETLVVRSKVSVEGIPDSILKECVRFLTPQHITANFAEVSGQYENIEVNKLFDFLKQVPQQYYKEDEIENEIPFTIDNIVAGIKITDPDSKNEGIQILQPDGLTSGFTKVERELTKKPIKITLSETGLIGLSKQIPLPKGTYKLLHVISLKGDNKINSIAQESSVKNFRLIHAVQRPVFINNNQQPLFIKIGDENLCSNLLDSFVFKKYRPKSDNYKNEQKYQVSLNEDLIKDELSIFPFSTSGEIIIKTEYNDYELNPLNENGWSYISKDYPKEIDKNKNTSINSPNEADKFYLQKSWSNLDESTENDKLDTLLKDNIKKQKIETDFEFFKHSFPDTKFRKVKYTLEAVSKFSEFFDIAEHGIDKKDKTPFSLLATLDKKNADGYYTIIENSAKPSKPNITSIVPVFSITNPEGTYTFQHNIFRIYLSNTWYETGLGEKIAVIHEEKANTLQYQDNKDPMVTMDSTDITNIVIKDSSYFKNKISIFANDPTDSIFNKGDSIKNNLESYISPDNINVKLGDSAKVNTYLFENSIDKPNQVKNTSKEHVFSIFDVYWDKSQNQFYCDIVLNPKAVTSYGYLLKFAICRYQEYSIFKENQYDYRFSDVVMTDMVSILPHREITTTGSNKYRIKGKKGGKYIFTNPDHENPIFNTNKIYLISETKKIINDGLSRITENKTLVTLQDFDKDITINIKDYETHFIEEYEDIPLNDDFYIDDNLSTNPTYNPREDPRKRLVFFYKITD